MEIGPPPASKFRTLASAAVPVGTDGRPPSVAAGTRITGGGAADAESELERNRAVSPFVNFDSYVSYATERIPLYHTPRPPSSSTGASPRPDSAASCGISPHSRRPRSAGGRRANPRLTGAAGVQLPKKAKVSVKSAQLRQTEDKWRRERVGAAASLRAGKMLGEDESEGICMPKGQTGDALQNELIQTLGSLFSTAEQPEETGLLPLTSTPYRSAVDGWLKQLEGFRRGLEEPAPVDSKALISQASWSMMMSDSPSDRETVPWADGPSPDWGRNWTGSAASVDAEYVPPLIAAALPTSLNETSSALVQAEE
eukprot:Hpha_TRINITY_DN9271_c0_g1::TRINITY_DN9271_c0_g1_i1::g.28640::m.28640